MIKSIIIDDEQHCINALLSDLKNNCPNVQVLETCSSAKAGIMAIKSYQPNLIFLDVEMPWMNGFEMLEILGEVDFSIIFITAHDEFAVKAFRICAIDYLLKPVDANDLKEAVQKAETKIHEGSSLQHISNLLRNMRQPSLLQKIALPNRKGHEFVDVASIIYCEAEGAYTKIYMLDNKKVLVSKTLGDIKELLPPELFLRIHHSTVVNISFITQFSRDDGGYVILKNGQKLSVSKAKKEALMERMGLK